MPNPAAFRGTIAIHSQVRIDVDRTQLRNLVRRILADAGLERGEISVAIVDDATIAQLNGEFLGHEGPTDVLTFRLDENQPAGSIDAEIVVGGKVAQRAARQYGWPAKNEVLLYAVHGALHLAGFDDRTSTGRRAMRRAEAQYLAALGLEPPWDERPDRQSKLRRPQRGRRQIKNPTARKKRDSGAGTEKRPLASHAVSRRESSARRPRSPLSRS